VAETGAEPILRVEGLCTSFRSDGGAVRVVDGVSFSLRRGETLGIVGESGSGKSVTVLSILRLLAGTTGVIEAGEIHYQGRELTRLSEEAMRAIRGNEIAMIFQEPMTCLNPVMRIGDQIVESILLHQHIRRQAAWDKALAVLESVRMPRARRLMREFPFQLSGGQRQRVMVAMALACRPGVLIADEPTTALDVTIQAQILELMNQIRQEIGTSILFITHDLGVVAEMCDNVVVMYCGRVLEQCAVQDLFDTPLHPYTRGLLTSIPRLGTRSAQLDSIPGFVPNPRFMPRGCKFAPRCAEATDRCLAREPDLLEITPGHFCKCWLHRRDDDAR
jgi:peptide/nickel transport system ATP-binding protein/oligopeptide transport system ATP-binding protein